MRVLNQQEVELERIKIIREIRDGAIIIYPTDTIYGIGCNALLDNSVNIIRKLKLRPSQPFSVIAPNRDWILQNCVLKPSYKSWLNKLPGPYTFILNLKTSSSVSKYVNPNLLSLGVRIPDHWFSQIISELGVPFVTTSVNKVGEEYMTSLEDLDPDIENGVHMIIYEGEKRGKPSTLVNLQPRNAQIIKRG